MVEQANSNFLECNTGLKARWASVRKLTKVADADFNKYEGQRSASVDALDALAIEWSSGNGA